MQKKKCLLLFLILSFLIQPCTIALTSKASVASTDNWSMFHHDPSRIGATSSNGSGINPQLLWNFTANAAIASSPAVANGYICFGSKDYNLYCLNATTGQRIWNFTTCAEVDSSPAIYNGYVYVGSGDGWLYCVDLVTGVPLWASAVEGKVQSSPAIVDERVFVGSGKHDFFCLNATDGALIWIYQLSGSIYSSPAVANGVVYIAADNYFVYALNTTSGRELWRTHTGSKSDSPCVSGGVIYTGSYDGYICALNASSGEKIWQYLTGGCVYSSPAVSFGHVFAGSDDNYIYCLDAVTGALVWRLATGFWVRSSPAIVNRNMYVGSRDYFLYGLDAHNGKEMWRFETGSYVDSSPAYSEGVLYIGSDDGQLYALCLSSSAETLPEQTASISWSTVLFDSLALAVAALVVYVAVDAYRKPKHNHQPRAPVQKRSWVTTHINTLYVLAILGVSSIFFVNLSSGHLWAADEQTYVQWAFHMYRSGDYITPWASGTVALWIGKPPLFMWLLSLSFQMFGAINFAARFWSPIFGAMTMVVAYFLGKTLYNRTVGFTSALILGTFNTFYTFARLAMTDMALLFFVVASLYFAVKHQKTPNNRYAIFSGIFFGLALMTKQIVAVVAPLLIILYLLIIQKSIKPFFSKQFALRFWAVAMLIFLPWTIYMSASFGAEFFDWFLVFSDISRVTGVLEGHSGGFFYYFSYLWNTECWWILLLPFATGLSIFKVIFRRSRSDLFVLCWMILVLATFSFIQTKLEWYILPVFPAFALSIGSLIYHLERFGAVKLKKRRPATILSAQTTR